MKRFIIYALSIGCVAAIYAGGQSLPWDGWVRVMAVAIVCIAVPGSFLIGLNTGSTHGDPGEVIEPINVWGPRPHEDVAHRR